MAATLTGLEVLGQTGLPFLTWELWDIIFPGQNKIKLSLTPPTKKTHPIAIEFLASTKQNQS